MILVTVFILMWSLMTYANGLERCWQFVGLLKRTKYLVINQVEVLLVSTITMIILADFVAMKLYITPDGC